MQLLALLGAVIAIGSVMFALQNNVAVTVNFLLWRFDSSLAMVLLLAVALGGLVVAMLSTPGVLRRQWTIGRQTRRIAELEQQNRNLEDELAAMHASTAAVSPAPAAERPYVGLKQLLAGSTEDKDGMSAR